MVVLNGQEKVFVGDGQALGGGRALKTCSFLHQDFELGSNNVGA